MLSPVIRVSFPWHNRFGRPVLRTAATAGLCLALLGACSEAAKDTHPQQWVSKRQAVFKQMTKALEPMGLVARGRQDYRAADFKEHADTLLTLAPQPWPLFAPDSNYPPTRARPAVWQVPADFKRAQDEFLASVKALHAVAGGGDLDAIRAAVNAVEKSCKSCHDNFRSER
ncbi:MAG: cytochrome c [Rhodoferax sp.]